MFWTIKYVLTKLAFGGSGVTVCGCFSFNCKLELHVLRGNHNGVTYRHSVVNAHVVPYVDNHPLADIPAIGRQRQTAQSSH